jgi:hypothetical protein
MSFSTIELLKRNLHAVFAQRDAATRRRELETSGCPEVSSSIRMAVMPARLSSWRGASLQ